MGLKAGLLNQVEKDTTSQETKLDLKLTCHAFELGLHYTCFKILMVRPYENDKVHFA